MILISWQLTIAWQYHDNTMRTWHLIMHFPPNDWSRRNENICQLLEKISVKTCKNICVRQLVPCTLSPRSGRRDGPPHLAGALRLSPACPDSWQCTVGQSPKGMMVFIYIGHYQGCRVLKCVQGCCRVCPGVLQNVCRDTECVQGAVLTSSLAQQD